MLVVKLQLVLFNSVKSQIVISFLPRDAL